MDFIIEKNDELSDLFDIDSQDVECEDCLQKKNNDVIKSD